jgi:hypothetical protein
LGAADTSVVAVVPVVVCDTIAPVVDVHVAVEILAVMLVK